MENKKVFGNSRDRRRLGGGKVCLNFVVTPKGNKIFCDVTKIPWKSLSCSLSISVLEVKQWWAAHAEFCLKCEHQRRILFSVITENVKYDASINDYYVKTSSAIFVRNQCHKNSSIFLDSNSKISSLLEKCQGFHGNPIIDNEHP